MATQIVMDATGDTRHEFDPADNTALADGTSVQRIDWSGLHRCGAQGRGSFGIDPQL
jgi:hypothetical protein